MTCIEHVYVSSLLLTVELLPHDYSCAASVRGIIIKAVALLHTQLDPVIIKEPCEEIIRLHGICRHKPTAHDFIVNGDARKIEFSLD